MAVSADSFGPFDSGTGANWTEANWRKLMRHLRLSDGVLRGVGSELAVFADSTGMQVKVPVGEVFIRGHWGEFTSTKTLPIAPAHGTLTRLDRVIARAHFTNNVVELDVLTNGTPGSSTPPTLTQDSTMWEVRLAQVSVPAADTSIDAAQVTDERDDTTGPRGLWVPSSSQSIANSTSITLAFGTQQRGHPDIVVSTSGSGHQFAMQKLGWWVATVGCRLGGTGGAERSLNIEYNTVSMAEFNGTGAIGWAALISKEFLCTSIGDAVRGRVFQDSGGSLSTTQAKTFFSLRWLGH